MKRSKTQRSLSVGASPTQRTWDALIYDIFLWTFNVVVDLFFREVHPRSTWRIPQRGPVIFVAAPHANQFVDALILMRTVRQDAKRRIAFLIAEKSMRRKFIGGAARLISSVSVGRALDMKKPAKGTIFLPDDNEPTLIEGVGTQFTDKSFMPGGLIVLPSVDNTAANSEIAEIVSPTQLRLKKPFKGEVAAKQLAERGEDGSKGTKFSVAPHVDQSAVYEAVFERIKEGGCIGIFPEGGSHDRTELLPLKPGVAVMALGALAENPDCGVVIVPVGMNYFHPHKFRSRAVIEFGSPIEVPPELVEQYKSGNKREATGKLLSEVYDGLTAVTTLAPDYDTLMLIQAVRRMYNPKGKKLPLSQVVELNRRLMKGYQTYKDDPRVASLRKDVTNYNKQLFGLNIRDHQLSYARLRWYKVIPMLIYRLGKLALLSIAVLPGFLLFLPVFIAGKIISTKKSREALAASSVKIRARDVVATWKILVSLALVPALELVYTCLVTYWTYRSRCMGIVPAWVPLWLVFILSIIVFPMMCYAALRFGEIGMDIFKSIRPLVLSLNPSADNTLVRLRQTREELQNKINAIVNELGPELFDDFEQQRILTDPDYQPRSSPTTPRKDSVHRRVDSDPPVRQGIGDNLPRNESFNDLSNIGLFATRPDTPNRSRSRTRSNDIGGGGGGGGGGERLQRMTTIESDVSKDLHEAMRQRGRRRSAKHREELGVDHEE